jgi:hypothetical protein
MVQERPAQCAPDPLVAPVSEDVVVLVIPEPPEPDVGPVVLLAHPYAKATKRIGVRGAVREAGFILGA